MSLPRTHMLCTVEEYLTMERASEVRHEYLDGEVFEMSGESLSHGRICTNLVADLRAQLRGKPCDVLSKDTKVQSGWLPTPRQVMKGLFSYPDVIVVCGRPVFHDEHTDILLNPVVITEVLSEATEAFDRGEKFYRYRSHLESLSEYVLVAQSRAFVDHYTKSQDGAWSLRSADGLAGMLRIGSIDCTLSLAEIYDRVEFPPEEGELAGEQ